MASRPVVALRALRISPQAQPFVFRISRRCLSQTSRQDSMMNNAARGAMAQSSRFMPHQNRSWRLRMKENEVPQDVGLLPGLYAPPRWPAVRSSISSVVKDRRLLWTVLYERIRQWWTSATMLYAWKFTLLPEHQSTWKFWQWGKEAGRPTFGWEKTKREAKELHRRLYTALAAGDVRTLEDICHQNALQNFKTRISRRRGEVMKWDADYHRVHLESLLVAAVPAEMIQDSAIMQAVFRVKSTQRLTRPKNQASNSIKEQHMVEHLVLQKNFWEAKEDNDWKIWGLVDEMSVKSLLEMSGEQRKVRASPFGRESWLQKKLSNTRLGKRFS